MAVVLDGQLVESFGIGDLQSRQCQIVENQQLNVVQLAHLVVYWRWFTTITDPVTGQPREVDFQT